MKIFFMSLFISSMALGQVNQVNVQNFNFNYQAPFGDGTADSFSYQKARQSQQKVHVEKIGEDFKILLEGVENQELTLKDAPEMIRNAEVMNMKNVNFLFADKMVLEMASAIFNSPEQNVDMKSLNLNCDLVTSQKELVDQVLMGCIQKMTLKSSALSTSGESSVLNTFMSAVDEGHNSLQASVGIKNLNMKVNSGKFELSAEVRAQISGTARASGNLKYDQSNKILTVKISEVKFGILNVTSKVFNELRKQESATLKVNEPYVYITLK